MHRWCTTACGWKASAPTTCVRSPHRRWRPMVCPARSATRHSRRRSASRRASTVAWTSSPASGSLGRTPIRRPARCACTPAIHRRTGRTSPSRRCAARVTRCTPSPTESNTLRRSRSRRRTWSGGTASTRITMARRRRAGPASPVTCPTLARCGSPVTPGVATSTSVCATMCADTRSSGAMLSCSRCSRRTARNSASLRTMRSSPARFEQPVRRSPRRRRRSRSPTSIARTGSWHSMSP